MSDITVHINRQEGLIRFLSLSGFDIDDLGNGVYRVAREDELPVFMNLSERSIYFEVDLGNVSGFADKGLYFNLLDLNTEIQPVSFGINNSNTDDPHLVLVESRETGNLNDHELLCVFDALELAVDKAERLLAPALK